MRYKQLEQKKMNNTAQQILESAYELFLDKGYKNVTTRDIASYAGVNLGLITYYFGTKDQLGSMVLDSINEMLYQKAFETKLPDDTGSAEKLCVYTVILWRYSDKKMFRFASELANTNKENLRMGNTFQNLAWAVIQDYHLSVTPLENEVYLTVFKSSELALIQRMFDHSLNITLEDIADILLSNYFFNIGLSDQTILFILNRCRDILQSLPLEAK